MFSLSEFFLIIFVALLVLGPNALQALLARRGSFLRKINNLIIQLLKQQSAFKKDRILAENNKRAKKVDEFYKEK